MVYGAVNDFEYFVGAFYSDKIEFNYKENQTFTTIPSYNNTNVLDNLDRNIALFGEFQYALSNHFSFITGLRYQQTTRDFRRDYSGFPSVISSTITSHEWLPMVSLSYGEDDYNTYLR